MLKLPTNIGEWGFVIVLSVLFMGLAFAIIYSQVHLHDMRETQARQDTESNLFVLAESVRRHYREHGEIKGSLTETGVPEEALETRHARLTDAATINNGLCTITAKLTKFGEPTCTLSFALDSDAHEYHWSD